MAKHVVLYALNNLNGGSRVYKIISANLDGRRPC